MKLFALIAMSASTLSTNAQNKKALASVEMTSNYTKAENQEGKKKSPEMEATRKIGEKQ